MSTSACPLPLVGVSAQPRKSAMCTSALWGVRMEACVVSGWNHVYFRSVGCQVGTMSTSARWNVSTASEERRVPCALPLCGVLGWNHVYFRSVGYEDGTVCGVRMEPCPLPLCGVSGWNHVYFRFVECLMEPCPLPLGGVSGKYQVYVHSMECQHSLRSHRVPPALPLCGESGRPQGRGAPLRPQD
ncbi:hypothetical protein NDU88_000927 [Pleurodeles waltl]|uniref:Uncharacterized protein n=1 Tax=Pleurodeles waltl TaxID=8319 RepID=A0AAV7MLZ3_PLEWA|nr:hypothetical protein NDU88_000927 [Pleurodeles waltl]